MGYTVDLQYAQDDIPNQLSQLENMITKGAKALIIASIDGTTLSDALQKAADAGVVVVAYDRLITKTANVDYYTTFDNFGVGVLQAEFAAEGPRRFPDKKAVERRAVRRLAGRQQRLLLLRRRHVGAAAADRQRHDRRQVRPDGHGQGRHAALGLAAAAQARMDNLLSANYSDGSRVDGVLCAL